MSERISVENRQPDLFARVSFIVIDDMDLDWAEIATFVALARYADFNDGSCFPGMRTIARIARVGSQRTLRKAVDNLTRFGYLKVERSQGLVNKYILTIPRAKLHRVVGAVMTGGVGAILHPEQDTSDEIQSNKTEGARAPVPAVAKPKDPIRKIMDDWSETFEGAFGKKPVILGGRDYKLFKRVFDSYGAELTDKMLRAFWRYRITKGLHATVPAFYAIADRLYFIVKKEGDNHDR